MIKKLSMMLMILLLCIASSVVIAQETNKKRSISEKFVVSFDYAWPTRPGSYNISPDGKRIANTFLYDNDYYSWGIVVDGIQGNKKYTNITSIFFSPDSKHLVYRAVIDDKQLVVIDSVESKKYDEIETLNRREFNGFVDWHWGDSDYVFGRGVESFGDRDYSIGRVENSTEMGPSIFFSPDSKRIGYVALVDDKQCVVVDGIEGKKFDGIGSLVYFNLEGTAWTYFGRLDDKSSIVFEGVGGKQYEGIPVLCPDGRLVAEKIQTGDNTWFTVVRNEQMKKYEFSTAPIFNSDRSRVAYGAKIGDKRFVVTDGIKGKLYDNAWLDGLKFSPDGKSLAYAAVQDDKEFVVVNDVEGKKYDEILDGYIAFSPDSSRMAYAAELNDKQFIVVDGKEGKGYKYIAKGFIIFSPDSKRIAYSVEINGDRVLILDGVEGKGYDSLFMDTLIFSPDSKRVAYQVEFDGDEFVVVDGINGKKYDDVKNLFFTSDSKHYAYLAKSDGMWYVVIDGTESKPYDEILGKISQANFDSPTSLHYFGDRDDKIYLVEDKIE